MAEDNERPMSITRKRGGWAVAPSPFNAVKLELGVALLIGLLLLLVSGRLPGGAAGQLLILLGYGTAASLWIVWRVRRTLRRGGRDGA